MSVIHTKITPPRQGQSLVKRTRLISELKNHVARNLILVQAPAGYGKTTLLYQLRLDLIEQGYLVAWYSLDKEDNEQITFIEYLAASLQHVLKRKLLRQSPQFFSSHGGGSIRPEISKLLNEVARTKQKVALILDDFHLISEPVVLSACRALIDYAPENLHILIGSRSKLPFSTSNLFAQGKAFEVGGEDLRFRIDETESFFGTATSVSLTPLQVYAIQGSTEGWAAGLQLTSLALKRKAVSDDLVATLAHQNKTVKNFLAEQVLDAQAPDVRAFLLRSSILQRFSAQLCNHVMAIDNAGDIIRRLEEDNLFLFSLSEDGEWYRYHHSFSAFLLSRLRYEMPDQVASLHIRACHWLSERGFFPEAINHAIEAQRYDLAKELLQKHAMSLVQQGKTTTLLHFMNRLPGIGTQTPAKLILAVAWSLILVRRPDEAVQLLNQLDGPDHRPDRALSLRKEAARLTALCWQEKPADAKKEIRNLFASGEVFDAWDYGVLKNNLIYASIFDGRLDEAECAYRDLSASPQSLYTTVYSKVLMGNCLKNKGKLYEAASLFQDAFGLSQREAGPQSPAAALAAANLVEILYEWNDLASVQSMLEGRLEVIDETSLNDVLLSVYRPLIRMYGGSGRADEAQGLISHVRSIAREHPYGMRLEAGILVEEIRILLVTGKAQAAANRLDRLCRIAPSAAEASPWMAERLREQQLLAESYFHHAQQHYSKAVTILDELCALACAWGNEYSHLQFSVFRALNQFRLEPSAQTLDELGRFLQLTESCDIIRSLTDFGDSFQQLLEEMIEAKGRGTAPAALAAVNADYLTSLHNVLLARGAVDHDVKTMQRSQPTVGSEDPDVHLTNRQIEILQLIASGMSNKEIAASLFIALDTVKWHLKIIYTDLQVNSRTKAIARAKEMGMI